MAASGSSATTSCRRCRGFWAESPIGSRGTTPRSLRFCRAGGALAGFGFHAGLRQGKLRHWILLGIALGLGWWAKYFVVILAAPLALFLLLDPDARRRLAAPGPWIGATVTLAVVAPNL